MAQAATTLLSKLSIVQLKQPQKLSPTEDRRHKLVSKLDEQVELLKDPKHAFTRKAKGGEIKPRTVRPWFYRDGAAVTLVIRYGATPLELQKGRKAISVAKWEDLPETFQTVIEATKLGELDGAITAVVNARKTRS